MNCEFQVSNIIKGHTCDLSKCIFPVEHPAIGAGEEGVGDVADAFLQWSPGSRAGAGALDPLALEVMGDFASLEVSLASGAPS